MRAQGAPLRFLALLGLWWIGVRAAVLWAPVAVLAETVAAIVPVQSEARASVSPVKSGKAVVRGDWERPYVPAAPNVSASLPMPAPGTAPQEPLPELFAPALADPLFATPTGAIPTYPDRWSASGWMVARAGRGIGAAPGGGQLGGGQAGMRLSYLLVPQQRIAVFTRFTAPLSGKGREMAVGAEWQPLRLPLRLVAEQRIGLDGVPGGPGIGVVTGVDAAAGPLRIEGYGQTGMVFRTQSEPYADGAVRVMHPVEEGPVSLSLGVGIWGAAQRGAQRLDLGPGATLSHRSMRVSLDWRQRVAGQARPGSGLAFTLGGDF